MVDSAGKQYLLGFSHTLIKAVNVDILSSQTSQNMDRERVMKSHPYPRSYWQLMASEADYAFFRDETPKSLPLSGS